MMRRSLLGWTLIAAIACPAAAAQQGVTVDPDSPAAKEYALPLDAARRAAASGHGNSGGPASGGTRTDAPAPLFGEGVGADPQDAPAGAAPAPGAPAAAGSPARTEGGSSAASNTLEAVVAPAASTPGAPDGGGLSTTLLIIAGGALVVGAGTVAGLVLRRRRAD